MDLPAPQQLPVSARWCLSKQEEQPCIDLEVARTPMQQQIGLMQRPALPPLRGMWFPFDRPRPLRFWMFNTVAPLDILFLRGDRVIAIEADVPVCPALPCPGYGPAEHSDGVVELGAGEARRLDIKIGDRVDIGTIP
ncbi:MAG: DUF192 domain-containing protein [Cyanobacteriota bacterium]|nr:DUF192 domain-containing protein [Cyanobacteriota bacterium]